MTQSKKKGISIFQNVKYLFHFQSRDVKYVRKHGTVETMLYGRDQIKRHEIKIISLFGTLAVGQKHVDIRKVWLIIVPKNMPVETPIFWII